MARILPPVKENLVMDSKCHKCEHDEFEIEAGTISGSKFKFQFIRCAKCKSVVTVMEYYNIGSLIKRLADRLKINLGL